MFPFALILSVIISGAPGFVAWAQAPQPPPAGETRTSAALPLTSIVLYSSGVGYFQRDGAIDGHSQVALRFKVDNINDLLKSMTVQDFDGGQITAVTYDSRDPVTRTLKSFAVDLTDGAIGITNGRAMAIMAAVVGLISLVVGGLALSRSAGRIGTGNGRAGAIVALLLGLIGMVLSVVHLGSSTGGFGTGSGRAGAIVALVLGLIGMNLGGLALARSRRSRRAD